MEIERMWGMKTTTIPVVIGALGLIKKGLEKYTKQIPGNIKISELQKIVLLGTSRNLRKTLSIKQDRLLPHFSPWPKEWLGYCVVNRHKVIREGIIIIRMIIIVMLIIIIIVVIIIINISLMSIIMNLQNPWKHQNN